MGAAGPQPRRARPVRAVQPDALLGEAGGGHRVLEPPHDQVRLRPGSRGCRVPCPGEWAVGRTGGRRGGRSLCVGSCPPCLRGRWAGVAPTEPQPIFTCGCECRGGGQELSLSLLPAPRCAPLAPRFPSRRLNAPHLWQSPYGGTWVGRCCCLTCLAAVVPGSRQWLLPGCRQAGAMLKRKKLLGLRWCVWKPHVLVLLLWLSVFMIVLLRGRKADVNSNRILEKLRLE